MDLWPARAGAALADLADLVLPRVCGGCGQPGRTLCETCQGALQGRPFEHRPTPSPVGFPPLLAAAHYDGAVRQLLLAHKERGRTSLAGPLGRCLAAAAGPYGFGVVLVPVPSAATAVRSRGHDHARRLAAAAARALGVPSAPLLVAGRRLADSSGLDTAARAANLAGALSARRRLDGLVVVVVDDVVTTGATLVEATRALTAAGAVVVGAAVVAATQRRADAAAAAR